MSRILLVALSLCLVPGSNQALCQASKQLDQRAKDAQSAQEKSWNQVDQINKETDQTNSRLKQSRQETAQPGKQSGSTVTKTKVGVESPYRKGKKAGEATKSPKAAGPKKPVTRPTTK